MSASWVTRRKTEVPRRVTDPALVTMIVYVIALPGTAVPWRRDA